MLLLACVVLLFGDLPHLISTTTTTTFVAAMSIANQDLDRHFPPANASYTSATIGEERIAMDVFHYAFLNWSYVDLSDNSLVQVEYKEEKARYGEGRILSVTGRLIHISAIDDISDDFACTPDITGTLGNHLPKGLTWIALVRRGRCTFEDKVKHVYQKNASGVIIYNDKQVMQLEKMQIKGKNRPIAAVITYQNIGMELVSESDKGHNITISIIEGRNGVRPVTNLNRTSVLFVSISFIVLMIISLVWLIFYYIQRFRYMQAKDQQTRNLCSVTKKAIMKIPTKTGKLCDEKDLDSDCCAICIETYKPTDIIRILPCKHEFHKVCIDPWLIEHRTCPMCKLDVLKFYGYVVGDQIYQTPSPQHNAPLAVAAMPVPQYSHNSDNAPIIVVAYPSSQSQQQPLQLQADISNFNASIYHQRSPSSSNNPHQPVPFLGRRNSAPAMVPQTICTASRQFLGSEESILEYEPDRPIPANTVPPVGVMTQANTVADLIRSRDFVFDFPRIFLREADRFSGSRDMLFPVRLPERSQSSLSLNQTSDWMSLFTNKLKEQQALGRPRKDQVQQQLLSVSDSTRQRRSRSADGRFANASFNRHDHQFEVNGPIENNQAQRSQLINGSPEEYRQWLRVRCRLLRPRRNQITLPLTPQPGETDTIGASAFSSLHQSHGRRINEHPENNDHVTIQVNGEGMEPVE